MPATSADPRRLAAITILAVPILGVPLYAAALHFGRPAEAEPAPAPAAIVAEPIAAAPAPVPVATPSRRPLRELIRIGSAAREDAASEPAASPTPAPAPSPTPVAQQAAGDNVLVVRRILDTGGPIRYGDYFWDDRGVPAGPLVITVDLAAETISAFRDGYEVGTAAIIFGDRGKETPLGVFPITQKDARHVSNLYGAPMPYMLRLTNDGVSIHGSKVSWEYATHGCIGVPVGFAKRLFALAKLGDKVIVTRGKTLQMGQRIERATT